MGGSHHGPDSIVVPDLAHLQRFGHGFRAVIETRKDVRMKIYYNLGLRIKAPYQVKVEVEAKINQIKVLQD